MDVCLSDKVNGLTILAIFLLASLRPGILEKGWSPPLALALAFADAAASSPELNRSRSFRDGF